LASRPAILTEVSQGKCHDITSLQTTVTEQADLSSNASGLYLGGTLRISAKTLIVLTEVFHGFPESFQANIRINKYEYHK
jgi:hypothetical protein